MREIAPRVVAAWAAKSGAVLPKAPEIQAVSLRTAWLQAEFPRAAWFAVVPHWSGASPVAVLREIAPRVVAAWAAKSGAVLPKVPKIQAVSPRNWRPQAEFPRAASMVVVKHRFEVMPVAEPRILPGRVAAKSVGDLAV